MSSTGPRWSVSYRPRWWSPRRVYAYGYVSSIDAANRAFIMRCRGYRGGADGA